MNTKGFVHKYEDALEAWIGFSSWAIGSVLKKIKHTFCLLKKLFFESPLVQKDSNALIKLTLFLSSLVFVWLLVSCQSLPKKQFVAANRTPEMATKQPDSLYIKRESLSVQPRFEGSTSGSIWADSQAPRHLIADARPQRVGEMITVNIPDRLRFSAFDAQKKTPSKSPKKSVMESKSNVTKEDSSKPNSTPEADPLAALAESNTASGSMAEPLLTNTQFENLSQFKMQIVGWEPQGDAFLRGTKTFNGPEGEIRSLTLLAKLPRVDLVSYQIDANLLGEISLVESLGNQSSEYIASGWDTNVSRRLSGWVPDLELQAEAYEGQKRELDTLRSSVKEQQKAILQERDRMLSERKRNNEQAKRLEEAYQKTQSNPAQSGQPTKDDPTKMAATPEGNATK